MFVSFVLRQLEEPRAEERLKAIRTLCTAFVERAMGKEECAIVERGLLLATRDPSPDVRLAMAEILAPCDFAPEDVIHFLSHDAEHIAAVVCQHSPILSDEALMLLAERCDEEVTSAIAQRHVVSPLVANALVEHGGAETALALLQNPGAAILKEDVFHIAKKHGMDAGLRDFLMSRDDLPLVLRHELLICTINALQDSPLLTGTLSRKKLDALMLDAFERSAILLIRYAEDEELVDYILMLRESGLLTPHFFVRAICQGKVRFLNEVLAQLTGHKARRVYDILARGSKGALIALLAKTGLPEECQLAVRLAVGLLRELGNERISEPEHFAQKLSSKLAKAFEGDTSPEAARLKAILQQFAAENKLEELKTQRFPLREYIGSAA